MAAINKNEARKSRQSSEFVEKISPFLEEHILTEIVRSFVHKIWVQRNRTYVFFCGILDGVSWSFHSCQCQLAGVVEAMKKGSNKVRPAVRNAIFVLVI